MDQVLGLEQTLHLFTTSHRVLWCDYVFYIVQNYVYESQCTCAIGLSTATTRSLKLAGLGPVGSICEKQ